jgi:hypothetical protein
MAGKAAILPQRLARRWWERCNFNHAADLLKKAHHSFPGWGFTH